MSTLDTRMSGLHIPAVVLAGVIAFFSGGLWYSGLVSGPWMEAHGVSQEQYDVMNAQVTPMILAFVAYVVTAFVFAALVRSLGIATAAGGLRLGIIVWLGFTATSALTIHVFSPNSPVAWLIDVAHQLVYLSAMGAVLGHFQGRRSA